MFFLCMYCQLWRGGWPTVSGAVKMKAFFTSIFFLVLNPGQLVHPAYDKDRLEELITLPV